MKDMNTFWQDQGLRYQGGNWLTETTFANTMRGAGKIPGKKIKV